MTPADLKLIRNERFKLLAGFFDRAGTGILTAGLATPLVGYSLDVGGVASHNRPLVFGAVVVVSVVVAAIFAAAGQLLLKELRA